MSPVQSVTYVPVRTVRGWCVERQMRRKLSLTLPLSLYKGEATRTPQLTIMQHYRSIQPAEKTLLERSVSLL
jgi:hypothetical protein